MPRVAEFDGIEIMFYYDEHPPPHFHAKHAEFQMALDIESLDALRGSLPVAKHRSVVQWASNRKEALMRAWNACRAGEHPGRIP
jgi:hypothetical protein